MATENSGANENKKAGEAAKKLRPADGKAPLKKKKIIIVTGNSGRQGTGQRGAYSTGATGAYSSSGQRKPRPAGQSGQGGQGSQGGRGTARRDVPAGRGKTEQKPVPHKIIRPSVKPTQMEIDYHKPVQPVRQTRKAEEPAVLREESAALEVKAAEVTAQPVQPAEMPAQASAEAAVPETVPTAEPVRTEAPMNTESGGGAC